MESSESCVFILDINDCGQLPTIIRSDKDIVDEETLH